MNLILHFVVVILSIQKSTYHTLKYLHCPVISIPLSNPFHFFKPPPPYMHHNVRSLDVLSMLVDFYVLHPGNNSAEYYAAVSWCIDFLGCFPWNVWVLQYGCCTTSTTTSCCTLPITLPRDTVYIIIRGLDGDVTIFDQWSTATYLMDQSRAVC